MSDFTFYWHDYETFGANPAKDRPSQFAGIRTNEHFEIIGDPLVIYCRPTREMLPHPEACLVTGITPQHALKNGLPEAEFIRQIHQELVQPGTCAAGYNSIRFDDEVTRYTLYRNFYDPYAREWQNGNSRWDIIDMVRVCRALRPEGINWPDHEDGTPSFRLEDITKANGISHEDAHDALSDVHATIAVAKLIKQAQPKLFDYIFQLRNKRKVSELLNVAQKKPVLHTSAMFPASRFCTALVLPYAVHPTNKNGVVCIDLSVDPTPLIELNAEQVKERLYTPAAQLPEGVERMPLKTIQINRCPVVATTKLMDDAIAQRLQIDLLKARQHYQQLIQAKGVAEKLTAVFSEQDFPKQTDPDLMLYSGGFFGTKDKETMAQVRNASTDQLRDNTFHFEDTRLPEMLFRYRARNYPITLSEEERLNWEEYCYQRLTDPEFGADHVMDQCLEKIDQMLSDEDINERDKHILEQLLDYTDALLA
jgi:exodeoxyribonuclease I